jgi:hypothetical protein
MNNCNNIADIALSTKNKIIEIFKNSSWFDKNNKNHNIIITQLNKQTTFNLNAAPSYNGNIRRHIANKENQNAEIINKIEKFIECFVNKYKNNNQINENDLNKSRILSIIKDFFAFLSELDRIIDNSTDFIPKKYKKNYNGDARYSYQQDIKNQNILLEKRICESDVTYLADILKQINNKLIIINL